jgi:prevent-host-death family protein
VTSTISATKAKNNFGALIDEVYGKKRTITIVRNNRPVVEVSPIHRRPGKKALTLKLTNEEYKKAKKAMNEFRKTFKFDF